ncbi:AAA family ATPase [Corynebacterium bovis]|uniref:ATP-dependent nuclease n=1 Tax=Corynebacterium bovis TaxID=36808 RepID=UPI00244D57B3|nr:AAA family ATPase [Corynebacterium bovis]MDH2455531.1 AAA family ATPase [Corynebacterium bovis]
MAPLVTKVQISGYRRFREFTFKPEPGTNIIVGGNEAGKSTLLEAMTLALTGRVNGVWASEYVNPYWFNRDMVRDFFMKEKSERKFSNLPEFRIDLYLEVKSSELEKLRGVNNMATEDSVGLSIWAHPDPAYKQELDDYFQEEDCPEVLPVEYYMVEWQSFAGSPVVRRPKGLGISIIDSRTIRSERGVDYYTRQIVESRLDPKDRNRIAVEHRKLRATLGREVLQGVNDTLADENQSIPVPSVGLQIDQSRSASWEATLIPDIEEVPLSMAGQGNQAVAKTVLAMGRKADAENLVFIEEPENHLSHTRLRKLISYIEASAQNRQVFITTHSSYVLNRLGLGQLTLISNGKTARFGELTKGTVRYFQKLSGFDTLRLILADLIVVVEGPSDEMVFTRFFADKFKKEPLDCGVDVMSVNGTSFARCFELAAVLNRSLFAIRDNDGQEPEDLRDEVSSHLKDSEREFYIGDPRLGHTLEPQIVNANDMDSLRRALSKSEKVDPATWMKEHKTDAALAIATSEHRLKAPPYMEEVLQALELRLGSAS